ncbi:unnamed protein product [Spirodela intermedia]|uniref:Uncharacterized protein n=1 Tax=Spirodela intermedia TaxID=51605 RepID=A0A7I8LDI6_SPIIN|nr:unnamed protein product [Spirodela intermedia]
MVEAVLSYVVNRVGDILIDEAVFLYNVTDQVEWVKDELRAMECFVKDADARSKGDERVKNWVRDVREIANRAEDLVDCFVLDAQRRRRRSEGFIRITVCCLPRPSDFIILRRFGKEIEAIKAKIHEINERRTTYGIQNLGGEARRQIDEAVRERRRVEKNRILEHLLNESRKKRSVISIVGLGGLGKTTLAKRVFKEARAEFNHSVWIDVSQQYSAVDLLRDFLRQVTELEEEELEKMTRDKREERLYQTIRGKKYLIVMDDVWDQQVWRLLNPHLPDDENGSLVLITTRSLDVARAADPSIPPHELRLLTEEESWELLSKKAFPNQDDIETVCSESLREVGKQITRKCGGLPLALVVLGGLLSTKGPSLREWRRLAETIVWENIEESRLCLDILALSYAELPHHLKRCFLYFSSFPEDFDIRINKLIRLWIAEGFIEHRAGETLEQSAECYLEELVRRCMVTVVQDEYRSPMIRQKPKTRRSCRIHDLLHDFTIAEAKEVGFLVSRQIPDDRDAVRLDSSVRRLSLHGGAEDYVSHVKSTPRLRTLLWFNAHRRGLISFPIPELKLLRVVDLEGAPLAVLPEEVGDLKHLRFLCLRLTRIRKLPSSVGKLCHLQSLDTSGTEIQTIPRVVWMIEALRHVHIPEVQPEMVETGLRHLQVLKFVRAGSWIDSCLGTLTNLRELGLTGILRCHDDALSSSLPKLSHLKKLILEGVSIPDCVWTPSRYTSLEVLYLKGEVTGPQQPSSCGNQWPLNLTELILSGTRLDRGSIAALENLPELTYLYLGPSSYTGNDMICSSSGFPQLQFLVLDSLDELERWVIEAGAMSRLRSLKIYNCRRLAMLPDELQHMTGLKDLTLWDMPPKFCSRARMEEEDWPKIRHISSITISVIGESSSSHFSARSWKSCPV